MDKKKSMFICTGKTDKALHIVAAAVLLDRTSYKATSCSRSRTSWVVPVEVNSSRLVAAYRTGLLEVNRECRALAVLAFHTAVSLRMG